MRVSQILCFARHHAHLFPTAGGTLCAICDASVIAALAKMARDKEIDDEVPCTDPRGHSLEGGWCPRCEAIYYYPGWVAKKDQNGVQ